VLVIINRNFYFSLRNQDRKALIIQKSTCLVPFVAA